MQPKWWEARWLQYLALFLVVVGARLWLVFLYGSPLPILDQWDGEAASVFKPWIDGMLSISDLFRPHNEHRLVLSRLLALGLLSLNGQWDSLLELAANALICGLIAIAVGAALIRLLGHRHRIAVLTGVMFWFSLPYAQENTLWGLQSSFYFLLLFSLLTIWGLLFQPAFSFRWGLGATGAILSCFSMASGFFAALATLGILFVRVLKSRRVTRDVVVTVVFTVVVIGTSLLFHVSVARHESLRAASFTAWLIVFGRCLAWPFCDTPAASLIIYFPVAWLSLCYFTRKATSFAVNRSVPIELLLAAAGWVMLQAAAIALTRAGDAHAPIASRYMDILGFGALVNFSAAMILLFDHPSQPFWRRFTFAIWTLILLVGSAHLSYRQITAQSGRGAYLRLAEQNVAAYVATSELSYLDAPEQPIPYPDAQRLAMLLDDPSIRRILPAIVREPLRIEKESDRNAAFIPNGCPPDIPNPPYERVWGSFTNVGAAARGSMETQPFTPHLHYLQIDIAGYLRSGLTLTVRGEQGANNTRRFVPVDQVDNYWRRGYVAVPEKTVRIIATDENEAEWFAFREPRELARFSYYTLKVIAKGKLVFLAGICIWVGLCFNQLGRRLLLR
jgi:hypothetical protein